MARRTVDNVIAVGTIDTIVASANPYRRHIIIGNAGTQTIYVRLGQAAALNSGMPFPVGVVPIELDYETIGNGIGLEIHAIAAAAGGALAIWASED